MGRLLMTGPAALNAARKIDSKVPNNYSCPLKEKRTRREKVVHPQPEMKAHLKGMLKRLKKCSKRNCQKLMREKCRKQDIPEISQGAGTLMTRLHPPGLICL